MAKKRFTHIEPDVQARIDAATDKFHAHVGSQSERFDFLPLEEWLELPADDVGYLVEGTIPRASLGVISGPPKLGQKTFLAMLYAYLIADGENYGDWEVKKPENVLFVEEEVPQFVLQQRWDAILHGLGKTRKDLKKRLFFQHNSGTKIRNTSDQLSLLKNIIKYNAKLVVIDPLNSIHDGDENSAEDMNNLIVKPLQAIIHATGATIIVIHHIKKDSGGGNSDYDMRGSTVLPGSYDFHISLRRSDEHSFIQFSNRSRLFETVFMKLWWDIDNFEKVKEPKARLEIIESDESDSVDKTIEHILEVGLTGLIFGHIYTNTSLINPIRKGAQVALQKNGLKAIDITDRIVMKIRRNLIDMGHLEDIGDGQYKYVGGR